MQFELIYNLYTIFNNYETLIIKSESIANIVELFGSSNKGWHQVGEVALEEVTKTRREITGLEVVSKTAVVDPNTDSITKYHATIRLAFGVERYGKVILFFIF